MQTTTLTPPRRGVRAGFVVAGVLTAFLALSLLAAGGAALWADSREDPQGFLSTEREELSTSTPALVSENLDIDLDGAEWLFDRDDFGKVRFSAESTTGDAVFVGVARTSDLERYLDGVAHTTVTDVDFSPFDLGGTDDRDTPGRADLAAPRTSSIWAASAEGTGTQRVTWDLRDGDWSIAVLNADGSPAVAVEASAAAQVPYLSTIGWSAAGAGALLAAATAALLLAGVRGPRRA